VNNPMERKSQEPLPLRNTRRCGARNRRGKPCQSPVVKGKRRCRMHGGALGSGAPRGSRNGNYRHGKYTTEALAERRALVAFIREANKLCLRIEESAVPAYVRGY
jgi:glucans biosynthesis protein